MTDLEKQKEYLQLSKHDLVEKLITCERYLYNGTEIVPANDIDLNSHDFNLTVGRLKEMLYRFGPEEANLPVFVERMHDHYFQKRGWSTLKVEGDYPEDKDEFIKSWCAVKNENGLLIYNHY